MKYFAILLTFIQFIVITIGNTAINIHVNEHHLNLDQQSHHHHDHHHHEANHHHKHNDTSDDNHDHGHHIIELERHYLFASFQLKTPDLNEALVFFQNNLHPSMYLKSELDHFFHYLIKPFPPPNFSRNLPLII